MLGGFFPDFPAAASLSVQAPALEVAVKPENVWKSSLSWQTSSEALLMVN